MGSLKQPIDNLHANRPIIGPLVARNSLKMGPYGGFRSITISVLDQFSIYIAGAYIQVKRKGIPIPE